jgi:hypothetical protein
MTDKQQDTYEIPTSKDRCLDLHENQINGTWLEDLWSHFENEETQQDKMFFIQQIVATISMMEQSLEADGANLWSPKFCPETGRAE